MTEVTKVAFLAGTLALGGAEKQMFLMVKSLKEHGVPVVVFTFTSGQYYENQIRQLGVSSVHIEGNRIGRLFNLYIQLRVWRPTVLHAAQGFVSPYVGILGTVLGIKSIGTIRSSIDYFSKYHSKLLLKSICYFPHCVVLNSKSSYDQIIRSNLLSKEKAKLLLNVIPVYAIPNPKFRDKLVLIYVGKLNYDKGVYDLIDTFNYLTEKEIDKISKLIIIGDGPEKNKLLRVAKKLSTRRRINIEFLENQDNFKIPGLMRRGDVLLFTSHSEGFPNVVLEGMAVGLATIATDVGDVPNVIEDGKDGYIVAPKSPKKIAQKIASLIAEPTKIDSIGISAHDKVCKNFNYNSLYTKLMTLYAK